MITLIRNRKDGSRDMFVRISDKFYILIRRNARRQYHFGIFIKQGNGDVSLLNKFKRQTLSKLSDIFASFCLTDDAYRSVMKKVDRHAQLQEALANWVKAVMSGIVEDMKATNDQVLGAMYEN